MTAIDLNADLGESNGAWTLGDDRAMLDLVTSASVAWGFHAGDPTRILDMLRLAAPRSVSRCPTPTSGGSASVTSIFPPPTSSTRSAPCGPRTAAGTRVLYVNPYGALYNRSVHDERQAGAVVDAVIAIDPALAIVGLPDSEVRRLSEAEGLRFVPEAFSR